MNKKHDGGNANDDDFMINYHPFLPNYDQKSDKLFNKDGKKKVGVVELCWEIPKQEFWNPPSREGATMINIGNSGYLYGGMSMKLHNDI